MLLKVGNVLIMASIKCNIYCRCCFVFMLVLEELVSCSQNGGFAAVYVNNVVTLAGINSKMFYNG